ncbi:LysR family transcriptional regulator [Uruburuella testudinis]|uniref:LysR family transcriptional regulator n=1 Tax=Uruburuella testudinis TaxID=1282863 RepID=A0ABY4DS47_9NEIS|nr:LysR family transcriptional regulator [Uruburuella testudinis]UOO81857.1 LysR family transcriptional regulator [Uruburuella testudinis]
MQDIKPLLVFAAVLEQGSMNAAAQQLGMTPSAVSQHITRLEKLHGVKLLHRSTRRLTPTDAGQALAQYCLRLRHTLADTLQALDNLKTEAAGDVNIALPSGMALAPPFQTALKRLQQQYPEIRPQLYFSDTLADLKQGTVDIALRGGEHALDAPDLIARQLAVWQWQICAAPEYLAAHAPVEHPEMLAGHRWLHYLPVHTTLRHGAESFVLDVPESMLCNQLAAVSTLTQAGLGLSMQLDGEIAGMVAAGRLKVVLPEWALPAVNIYAVTPYRVQSAKTEVVLRLLQQSFADTPGAA